MNDRTSEPKALFLSPDGNIYPDPLICSGILPALLKGKSCPYSQAGRFPEPLPLNPDDPNYSIDKGQPGDKKPTLRQTKPHQPGTLARSRQAKIPPRTAIPALIQVPDVVVASRPRTPRCRTHWACPPTVKLRRESI